MNRRVIRLCTFPGCRESVGKGYVCRSHWPALPVLLQRALTGARGPERAAAERQVDEWLKTRQLIAPSKPPAKPFSEPKDQS